MSNMDDFETPNAKKQCIAKAPPQPQPQPQDSHTSTEHAQFVEKLQQKFNKEKEQIKQEIQEQYKHPAAYLRLYELLLCMFISHSLYL